LATTDFELQVQTLYDQEYRTLFNRARARLGDFGQAEDSVQEAFANLVARGHLKGVQNPAALLFSVLECRITDQLRKAYRRKEVPLDEIRAETPSGLGDPGHILEQTERARLLAESMTAVAPGLHGRFLRLRGLGYKAGQIAAIETAAGRPTTPRQVTTAIYKGKIRLRQELKQRCLESLYLPIPAIQRVRYRLRVWFSRAHECSYFGNAYQAAQGALVMTMFSVSVIGQLAMPSAFTGESGNLRASAQALQFAVSSPAYLPGRTLSISPSPTKPDEGAGPGGESIMPRRDTSRPLPNNEANSRGPSGQTLPAGSNPGPGAVAVPDAPSRYQDIVVETPDGGKGEARLYRPDQDGKPAQPLTDQTLGFLGDQDQIPLPECGGLPACDEMPKNGGDVIQALRP